MGTQLSAWLTGSLELHKTQTLEALVGLGAQRLRDIPTTRWGFGDRESLRLQGWPLWYSGRCYFENGVITDIHDICVESDYRARRKPSRRRRQALRYRRARHCVLQMFARIISYPECVEAVYCRNTVDAFPKFASWQRLGSIINCREDEPVEYAPGCPEYWEKLGPQLVWAAATNFSESQPAAKWAIENRASVQPYGNGWLFDCGYSARWPGDAWHVLSVIRKCSA
jgi:hypothetical protein